MVVAAATAAKVAMVARAKDSSPGSSSSITWVEATEDSGRVVVVKAEEATMVAVLSLRAAAMVVSGRVVVDINSTRTDKAATEVAAKVVADTTIKVVAEAIREVEEVQAVAAEAVVAEDNSGILPSSLLTL